ncbi:hypothetical protein ACEWY4_025306 [Coilia grayii]|uniref:Uncharacterized protein n=1 Tax=Coilia grayii TaxID=363190 RepID=A0ABD1IX84_9TELE
MRHVSSHCSASPCLALSGNFMLRCRNVPVALVQIDAGAGQVFGVDRNNNIYTQYGESWVQVPGRLKQVTVGPAGVWGVNNRGVVFKLVAGHLVFVPGFNFVPTYLKQIDAGGAEFVAGGVSPNACAGDNWQHIPGYLSMIEVGTDGSVFGVTSRGNILHRDGISKDLPEGIRWRHVPLYSGQVKQVSYDLGHLWIILKNDLIYDCIV